jgi:hypothetical protein
VRDHSLITGASAKSALTLLILINATLFVRALNRRVIEHVRYLSFIREQASRIGSQVDLDD